MTALQKQFENHMIAITKRTGDLLRSRYGLWALGIISFVESFLLLPIITDPFLVAYIIAHRKRTVTAVVITTLTSIAGGVVAYITAAFFIELITPLLSDQSASQLDGLIAQFSEGAFVVALAGAVTPIPFTLVAIGAGVLKGNLLLFILGALLGRIIRYGIIAYLTYRFADTALSLAKRHFRIITIITFLICAFYFFTRL